MGENTNKHDKLRAQHEAALKQLQTAYAQAMGIGLNKPNNQLLPNTQASAKDDRPPTLNIMIYYENDQGGPV